MEKLRAMPSPARFPLFVYRVLFPVVFLAMLPGVLTRMFRRGNYRNKFGERFGFFSREMRRRLEPGGWTWIHAVSVGETMMALELARSLQSARPGLRVLLSTTTSTGLDVARSRISDGMELIYYPIDLPGAVRRSLEAVRPERVVLVDKDFWPNMATECYRRSIPVSIVNARLSPRSERRYRQWRGLAGPFFAMLHRVCVQESEDIERWAGLGVRLDAIRNTGSLKFDTAAPAAPSRAIAFRALLEKIGVTPGVPVLLGGSTFPGEETVLCRVLLALRPRFPEAFLILVPRHVERVAEIVPEVRQIGLPCLLRSELETVSRPAVRPDVLIVDTTGELRDWYAVATACFIGKSLLAVGGQNPAEPVLAGCPVLVGPHMENFEALVRQFLAANGVIQVHNEAELAGGFECLLADPARGAALTARALSVLQMHAGANRRTAGVLLELHED